MAIASAHVLGDDATVRAAYAAHGGELYRFALRALGEAGVAEEAVQEVFLRAWRASERYDPVVASLRTWLFAIARNVVIDLHRARAARPQAADLSEGVVPAADDPSDAVLRSWQVEEALGRIGKEHRTVIVETYYRGRPHAEVAADLGIPEGTLRSRLYYGLRALRVALDEVGWSDDGR